MPERYHHLTKQMEIIKMKSFNQELKDEIVAEIIKHREQDQIIQGTYGGIDNGIWKGCAVGCAIHSLNLRKGLDLSVSSHKVYEEQFGIPMILAKLEDQIFEGLSVEDSKTWPENFMSAVPVDTDLSLVWPKFVVWLLTDETEGVIKFAKNKEIVQRVSDLYLELNEGRTVGIEDWQSVRRAAGAYAAAADAAYAAGAGAYAAYAADAAADAYAYAYAAGAYAYAYAAAAAAYAAYAYAYAYAGAGAGAGAAARKLHYKKMADKLIETLKDTK